MFIKELYQGVRSRFLKLLRPVKPLLTGVEKTERLEGRSTLELKFKIPTNKNIKS